MDGFVEGDDFAAGIDVGQIEGDVETGIVLGDIVDSDDTGETVQIFELAVGPVDFLNVAFFEEADVFVLAHFFDRIDDEDFPSPLLGLVGVGDEQAGLHRGVVKEVRAEPDDAFDDVAFDHLAAHGGFGIAEEDAVRPEGDGAPVFRIEAFLDVLLEGVVGTALRRGAPEVASPRIVLEGGAIPGFDRVGWIGEDDVEGFEAIVFQESGFAEGVAADDLEFLDAVHEHVHAGDGGGDEIDLLAVELEGAIVFAGVLKLEGAIEEQAPGAAGGIVDALAGLRIHDKGHEADDGSVGVELSGGVAAVVGELLDEIFVSVAELVVGDIGNAEGVGGEVLEQVDEGLVREAVFVRPRGVAEDAAESVRIGLLDGMHGLLDGEAEVGGGFANLCPVILLRDEEAVELRAAGVVFVAVALGEGFGEFLVVDVTNALEEEQREDELLIVPGIDMPTQVSGRTPEVFFEGLLVHSALLALSDRFTLRISINRDRISAWRFS